jgi:hypothetical protein
MRFGKTVTLGTVVVALIGGFALGAQVDDHSAPFDGYWWRAAPASQKLIYVFGWEMGVNQGEMVGCQEALPSDKAAADRCIMNGAVNRLTQGVSMGDMVAMADRYYNDPKHAADPPTTALITALNQFHAK